MSSDAGLGVRDAARRMLLRQAVQRGPVRAVAHLAALGANGGAADVCPALRGSIKRLKMG